MASNSEEGLPDDETNLSQEIEDFFTKIVQSQWNTEKLYADLSFAKQQVTLGQGKELTPDEKQYLHALLVLHDRRFRLYSFRKIERSQELEAILNTSNTNLYRYIEIITSQPSNTLNSWENAAKLLKDADYKKSHFSTLPTRIKKSDTEILKASLRDLGITFKTNADVRGSGGMRVRADIVAVLEGNCDLGWVLNEDGGVDLVADLWGVSRKQNQTDLINSINQKFAVNKALAQVKNRRTPERANPIRKPMCPRCESTQTIKYGFNEGKQNYKCQNCGTEFTEN